MYERARRGEIRNVTGIDDPYEEPLGAELTLETETSTPEENARRVLALLAERGFVSVTK
jgi:adenylylsulfate kinase-like enzyme